MQENMVNESKINYGQRKTSFIVNLLNQTFIGTFICAFTPIEGSTVKAFNATKSQIVWTSTIFLVGNILAAPFVYSLVSSLGMTKTINISVTLALIGCLLRNLIGESFDYVIIGQLFLGLGACFLVNTTLQFCSNWYNDSERPTALSLLAVSNILGGGLGNFIPILFVTQSEKEPEKLRVLIRSYNYWITFLWSILTLLNYIFLRGKPDDMDEPKDKDKKEVLQETFSYSVQALKQGKFLIFVYLYSNAQTSLATMAVLANIIVVYFGSPAVYGSLIAIMTIIFGLSSSIFYSIKFMKYKNQCYYAQIYSSLTIIGIYIMIVSLVNNKPFGYIIAGALFGFGSFPTIPNQMEQIGRYFPQIPFHVTNTLLIVISQLYSVVLLSCFNMIRAESEHAFFIFLTILMCGWGVTLLLNPFVDKQFLKNN